MDKFRALDDRYSEFRAITWHSSDRKGTPIYHTNVVMAVLRDHVLLCLDSIKDPKERDEVILAVQGSGKTLLNLSFDEVEQYCGNALMLSGGRLICSSRAKSGYSQKNREELEKYTIITAEIPTIEDIGGGSARCMLAELF